MKPRIRDATVVALLAGPIALAAQERSVTLEQATQQALRVQPSIFQARADIRTAGAAKRTNTGSFLPSVNVNGSTSRSSSSDRFNEATGQIVSVPTKSQYDARLNLSLELFDGFRRFAQRRAVNADIDAASATFINQRFQVVLQTKQAFFAALENQELVRVAETRVQRAQRQLRVATEKLRAGSATRSDTLRSRVELGRAQLALIRAEANLATARANLGRQIGVEGEVGAVTDSALLQRLPPLDFDALAAEALGNAPTVVQAEAQAQAARARVGVDRAQYWPSLTASLSNTYSGTQSPFSSLDSYINNRSLSLRLSWTIFNGFRREEQLVRADAQRDIAEARSADARRQVLAELIQQVANLEASGQEIDIAAASLTAAREDLRVQQERYRVGAATILDLLISQESLGQADVDAVSARFNYLIARAQLEALIGRDL